MVEEPTQDLDVPLEAIREEEQDDFKEQEDQENFDDHEREKEQPTIVLFTPEQLEVLFKMNRLDFTELVAALKGGSSKGVGFQPTKPKNFDGIRNQKGCRCLACRNGGRHSCCQGWMTFYHRTCPILLKRLCFHMVEDSEARGREDPWLHMGILQGMH